MELILISDSKLKITLTSDDMAQYELDCDTMDYDNTDTRRAFREIFDHVKSISGFDTAGDRLFIQLYPSREGGCEMYITKLGLICAEKREREREREGERGGAKMSRGPQESLTPPHTAPIASSAPASLPRGGGERDRLGAYRFEKMDHLLRVCRQLAARGYAAHSSAYRDERDRYFLLLRERGGSFGTPCEEYAFITEFGTPENAEYIRLYISEHGAPICEGNAVNTLSHFSVSGS